MGDWSDKGYLYFGTASAGRMFMTPNFTGHLYGKFDYLYGDFSKDENYQAMVASIGTDLKYSFQLNNAGLRLMPSIYYEIGYDFSDDASIYAMGSNTVLGEYNLGDIVQRYGAKVGLINGMGTKVNVGAEMIHQDNYRNVEFRVEALFKF